MGVGINAESRELLKMMLDGEWRAVDDVRNELVTKVAPGRALRNYEVRQAARLEKIGQLTRKRADWPEHERIRSGARTLASAAIASMRNYFVFKDDDEHGRMMRLRDDIPNPLRPAIQNPHGLTEEMIRTIVREEIAHVMESLDEFQVGLWRYLESHFDGIEQAVGDAGRRRRTREGQPTQ